MHYATGTGPSFKETDKSNRVKVAKNKCAPPFRQAEFDIMFGEGISRVGELIDMASEAEIVKKSGAWFSYGDQRIGQGRENAKSFLKQNPDMADEIEAKLREAVGITDAPDEPPVEEEKPTEE